ncbi:MarR family winged helix-turn-helix transcriptional regulator [Luteipulveratus flavus]|uniref:MarR family transcriptional regulator n=1 Tax=Luteipulveratus flavus TaxID=3031728 RepID=A0ABT6CCC7_9MICO|nr:MarR family transcriptional regulator [Luteipulveratus sp. YIM 133296]MDF8264926.1 MarR family transcriptional regulator [Luteipulveratus sp. YIM 133296]
MSGHTPLPFDPIQRAAQLWRERWGDDAPYAAMASATSVMRAQQLLLAELDGALAPFRLTFARYEALVLLTFSSVDGLPMSKVGERLMIHPTSATNIVQRLVAQGLVERVPNPRDGRGALARITAEGREVMERAARALHDIEFGMGALDASEHAELFGLLHTLRVGRGDFVESD